MAISEELELDISGALDAIESLNEPLTQLGESLTTSLNTAIDAVDIQPLVDQLASLDASGVTTTIDAAVDQVDGTVPVDADTAQIPVAVDEALQALTDLAVPVGADAAEIPADVDFALAALTDLAVTVDADTSSFGGSIDEALAAANSTVVIDADASSIGDAVDSELATLDTTVEVDASIEVDGFDDIQTEAEDTTTAVEGVGTASTVAGQLATGSFEGAASGLGQLAGPVGGVAAGFAAVFGVLIDKGIALKGVLERARQVAGPFFEDLQNINVGTLNSDLGKLAVRLGSNEGAVLDAATNAFLFAKNAGLSGEAAAEFSDQVIALSARAVALNPALGSVDEVAARLQKQLLSGRGLNNFVGQLDDSVVAAKALEISGKTSIEDLSKQDLAFARAALGAEKYGGTIEEDINKGSKNAIIQQRALNAQISDFLAQVGKPLVAPFLKLMKEALPIVKALAPVFADLGKDTIPILAQSLKDSAPTIQLFGETLRALTPLIRILQNVVNVLANPLGQIALLRNAFEGLVGIFSGLGATVGDIAGDVLGFFTDLGSAGDSIPDFSGIFDFFTDLPGTITGALGDATSALSGFAGEGANAVLGFFSELPGRIFTVLQRLPGLVVDVFISTLTDAAAAVAVGSLTVVAAIALLPGKILEALRSATGFLITAGTELIQGFLDGVTTAVPAVLAFFAQLPGQVVTAVGETLTTLVTTGSNLIQGFSDGIQAVFPVVVRFFQELPGAIVGFIGNVFGTLKQQGIDIINGFISGAAEAGQGVIRFFQGLPGAVINAVGNVLRGAGSLFGKGLDIIQGLIDGMIEKAKSIPGIIKKKILSLVPDTVENFFKSGSPSKLMAGMGRDITAGLALGIGQEASAVEKAISDVSKQAVAGISSIPAALPIPGISKLPAVAAALPSAAASASTVGFQSSAQAAAQGAGAGIRIDQLIVQTTAPNQTQVGIEVARQLRAESFRAGR